MILTSWRSENRHPNRVPTATVKRRSRNPDFAEPGRLPTGFGVFGVLPAFYANGMTADQVLKRIFTKI
jgi:hypothetical protein